MLRSLSLAACAVAASAQKPTWFGTRPTAGTPNSLDLVDLDDGAVVRSVIGTVALGAGEYAWPDAMRCVGGACLFATSTTGAGAAPSSFVYRVNSANAAVIYKAPAAGVCPHMHADYATGHAYTLCLEDASTGFRAVVTEVTGTRGTLVCDITTQVNKGKVAPGQTTHCSATHSLYVGVDNGGVGDVIITVDLVAGRVTKVTTLQAPLVKAIWGRCDGSGVVGGLNFVPGATPAANGTASFGVYDSNGAYNVDSTIGVPANHEPSGLFTATSVEQAAFVSAFYPKGTYTNVSTANGYLWAVDPYGGGSDDVVTPFSYMLIAAAWDAE